MPSNPAGLIRAGRRGGLAALAFGAVMALGSCRQDMHNAPRVDPYEASDAFEDQRGSRTLVEGTVARGHLNDDELLYTGKQAGQPVDQFPFAINRDVLARGQQRYNIYCSPCHGRTGMANGMVVQRGLRPPPSFHEDRLRAQPAGYYFDVMTNGFGAMQDYRAQVEVQDRWAIAAYIRALQYSQRATVADVPEDKRGELDGPPASDVKPAPSHGSEH